MTWLIATGLAVVAFLVIAFVLRAPRASWTTVLAALALGLAGYALQATPGLPGAPKEARSAENRSQWPLIEARQELVAPDDRSRNPRMITADALARRGQFANAAAVLRGAVEDDPGDAEAWLALGNVLVEHADGVVTEPALFAWRKSSEADGAAVGPGYFLGLAMLRQGRFAEGYEAWQSTLASAPASAAGRAVVQARSKRLGELLKQAGLIEAERATAGAAPSAGVGGGTP